jgi:hypothetical protein
MFVAEAATLMHEPLPPLPQAASAAVWFASIDEVYRVHAVLADERVVALAANEDVAARLAIFTRQLFLGGTDTETLAIARAFAANRTFLEAGSAADIRRRPVPHTRLRRILVQLDNASHGNAATILDFVNAMVERGIHVSVHGQSESADLNAFRRHGIEVLDFHCQPNAALTSLLRDGGFDAVSAHDSFAGAAAAATAGVLFVQSLHDPDIWRDPDRRSEGLAADRHTAAYVTTSPCVLSDADQRAGLDVAKMVVVATQRMVDDHLWLFEWLLQGGSPASVRACFRRPDHPDERRHRP